MFDNHLDSRDDSPNSTCRILLREVFDESIDAKVVSMLKNLGETIQSRQLLINNGLRLKDFSVTTMD